VKARDLVEGTPRERDVVVRPLPDGGDLLLDGPLASADLRLLGTCALELRELTFELGQAPLGLEVTGSLDLADLVVSSTSKFGRSAWRRSSSTWVTRYAAK